MNARRKGSIVLASVIVALIGSGAAVSGGGNEGWRKALEARGDALNQQYGLGAYATVAAASRATPEPPWLRALRLRSEALNRQYRLGVRAFKTRPAPHGDELAPWRRALRIRSDALNRQHKLGAYAPRS